MKYSWLKGGNSKQPLPIKFHLANGAEIDLVPFAPVSFFMSNDYTDGRKVHKVTLTRPYWMSKTFVTAAQWREFDEDACLDVLDLEKAIGADAYVSKMFPRNVVLRFCKYLTEKYKI